MAMGRLRRAIIPEYLPDLRTHIRWQFLYGGSFLYLHGGCATIPRDGPLF